MHGPSKKLKPKHKHSNDIFVEDTPEEKLIKLQKRKQELITRIFAVDGALAEEGIQIEYESNHVMPKVGIHATRATSHNPQSGIRINGKLSFRGHQKASEYFDRLDEDRDGYLTFDDFRAMVSTTTPFGIVQDQYHLLDWEAWRIYLDDLGIKTDALGRVDRKGFIKYRSIVELDMPLSRELSILSLDFLPQVQIVWRKLKVLIADVFLHRKLTATFNTHDIGRVLHLDDIAYILSNLGMVFTRDEFVGCMRHIVPFQLLTKELLRTSFRKHYTTSNEVFGTYGTEEFKEDLVIKVKNMLYLTPEQLTSWVFGRRPEPKQMNLYRRVISLKMKLIYYWRKIDYITRLLFDAGMQIRLRLVFRDFRPLEKIITKDEKTFLNSGFFLGNKSNGVNDGIGLTWNTSKLAQPEDYFIKIKLPKDCGTSVSFELQLKSETTPQQAKRAADALVIFLRAHFDDELKKNAQYRGISVQPSENEVDGAPVLRIAIGFKRLASIDTYFDYIFVPYSLFDLIPDFAGSFRCSLTIYDLLHAVNVQLDTSFSCQALWRVTFVRHAVLKLLQRTFLALSSNIFQAEVIEPDDPEEKREINIWSKLKAFFPPIINTCKSWIDKLKGMRSGGLTFRFRNLSEFITMMRMDQQWIKNLIPPEVSLSDLGLYLNTKFLHFRDVIVGDYNEEFNRLKKFLEDKVLFEEAERSRKLMGLASIANADTAVADVLSAKADLMSKLESLGINSNAAELVDEDSVEYEPLLREMKLINAERDVQAMIAYERLWHSCTGVHAFEIVCGKTRISGSCQGLELLELLPMPPSLIAVKDACEKRSRKHLQKRGSQEIQSGK